MQIEGDPATAGAEYILNDQTVAVSRSLAGRRYGNVDTLVKCFSMIRNVVFSLSLF